MTQMKEPEYRPQIPQIHEDSGSGWALRNPASIGVSVDVRTRFAQFFVSSWRHSPDRGRSDEDRVPEVPLSVFGSLVWGPPSIAL